MKTIAINFTGRNMKNFTLFLFSLLMLLSVENFSQLHKDGWEFGAGLTLPRLQGSQAVATGNEYGGFFSIQRDFSEHMSFRAKPFFNRLTVYGEPTKIDVVGLGLDVIYTILPCHDFTPYLSVGLSSYNASIKKAKYQTINGSSDYNYFDYSSNFAFGVKYKFAESDFGMNAELGYHSGADNKLDGLDGNVGGILGGRKNSWMTADLGVLYYFGMGDYSRFCELEGGLKKAPPAPSGDKVVATQYKASGFTYPPVYKDSWILTFGGVYPRFSGTDENGMEGNYGLFAGVQRDLSEHFGVRAQSYYTYLSSRKLSNSNSSVKTNLVGVDVDWLYRFVPAEPISPYFGFGLGGYYMNVAGAADKVQDGGILDFRVNFVVGADWKIIGDNWSLKTEFGYYSLFNDRLDGKVGLTGGLLGGVTDTYMAFLIGANYAFDLGEKSSITQVYDGIVVMAQKIDEKIVYKEYVKDNTVTGGEPVDYKKIEDIVKKYSKDTKADPIDYSKIEKIIKENSSKPNTNWVLIGVNFDFTESTIKSESYPILANAAEILLTNPTLKVEIQGHTDNVGSAESNIKLSQRRSEMVRDYLVSKGVATNRLTVKGYGDKSPISDNTTAEGRALNRRVEFKVIK